jgi:hypothetical protein
MGPTMAVPHRFTFSAGHSDIIVDSLAAELFFI